VLSGLYLKQFCSIVPCLFHLLPPLSMACVGLVLGDTVRTPYKQNTNDNGATDVVDVIGRS
jgi:hypothetical protein